MVFVAKTESRMCFLPTIYSRQMLATINHHAVLTLVAGVYPLKHRLKPKINGESKMNHGKSRQPKIHTAVNSSPNGIFHILTPHISRKRQKDRCRGRSAKTRVGTQHLILTTRDIRVS